MITYSSHSTLHLLQSFRVIAFFDTKVLYFGLIFIPKVIESQTIFLIIHKL